MKKILSIISVIVMSLFSASCGSDSPSDGSETGNDNFTIAESYLQQDFKKDASSVNIPVTTSLSRDKWSVTSDQSWCIAAQSISKNNEFTISVQASEETDVREATVTVKSPSKPYEIKVRQIGYGPAILVKNENISAEAQAGTVTVTVTSNVEYKIEPATLPDWISEVIKSRAFVDRDYNYQLKENTSYEPRTVSFVYTYEKDPSVTATCNVTQKAKSSSTADVQVVKDILVKVTSGKASENQPGQGIENSFDGKTGDAGSPYHSIWSQSAKFPVVLEYNFDGTSDIDYLIYYSRNGNGNFGKFDLYAICGNESAYSKIGSYDFQEAGGSTRLSLTKTLSKVKSIKFEVTSGLGDYVSCDEMEFYRKNEDNSLNTQLLSVFTDLTCSALRSDANIDKINALPGFFGSLAIQIRDNKYSDNEKDFRIRSYEAYSSPEEAASVLMTNKYTRLDNPTGIYAEAGKEIVVLVGDTHGHELVMQCVDGTNTSGDSYYLKNGVNKFTVKSSGMLYVIYTASPDEKPIKIHIPSGCGTINGFFDLNEHKTDAKYAELLNNSTYKYFVIKGNRIMFCFHRSSLVQYVPNEILSAINLWDDIIGWEQELMGIDDLRPSKYNNHVYAISPEDGYMWATDYCIGFVNTYLGNILLKDNVMKEKDNAWGPAHEIGHLHQLAINWPSSTESSNNLFSNYVLYKLGKYCSRGAELKMLADSRFGNKQGWYNMGDATHQNESTEIHMRMNWQLWNYYHRCGYNTKFWQTLFKLLRDNRIDVNNPGEGQLKFAMMASKAANQNLTDFFELWGFFVPVNNVSYEQYGTYTYNVTSSMITAAKQYMAQFPAPKHAFQYLEDRKTGDTGLDTESPSVGYYSMFKDNVKITKDITYSLSGQSVTVNNGQEAVAFEVKQGSELVYFSNMFEFEVPSSVSMNGASLYAVQADGERKLMKKQ